MAICGFRTKAQSYPLPIVWQGRRNGFAGQMPGMQVEYRVCAIRTTLTSGYSNVAVVYGSYGFVVLEMSKAA